MDQTASDLAEYLVERLHTTPASARLLVGLSGIPASGKSSLADLIVHKINQLLRESSESHDEPSASAILVGLDGWHLTRAQLDAFPEPKLAHDRRGAHWTFDGVAYAEFIRSIRQDLTATSATITAPSFDHALKDPTPDAVFIQPYHRIVVIEGLYTFLSIEPWSLGGKLLDERWFLEVGADEAQQRLVKRHVATGVTKDMEEAVWRAEENDIPNGRFIIDNILNPTKTIQSINDPVLVLS